MTALLGVRAHQQDEQLALIMGRAMLAVDRALTIRIPEKPTADHNEKIEAATRALVGAGQDTRLSAWVYGRLQMERQAYENSLRDTRPDPERAAEMRRKIAYLGRVKYLIDAPK